MKAFCWALLLLFSTSGYGDDSDEMLTVLGGRLLNVATKHNYAVQIDSVPDSLTISYNTMAYQIHAIDKTGTLPDTTHEEIGPKVNGFILTVVPQRGPYRGAAVLPQTIARPNWKTFVTFIPADDNQNHLHITFSYGRKVPDRTVAELTAAIEKK